MSKRSLEHLQEYIYTMTYLPKSFYGEVFLIYIVGRNATALMAMIITE